MVSDWNDVLTPPYDVISPEQQQAYHDRDPHNIIHVDYGLDIPGENKYERAAGIMKQWVADGVVVQDPAPAIYVTEHEFLDQDGKRRVRRGFMALLRVEPFSGGNVLPHEKTFKKHKKDRLELLRASGTQMNPVFTIFPDPDGKACEVLARAAGAEPDMAFDFVDGAVNRMWRLTDESEIKMLQKVLKKQPVFIADGHHRYETMLNFRKEIKKGNGGSLPKEHPAAWGLVYFCAADEPGLEVTSPHRLLRDIPDFDEQKVLSSLDQYFTIEKTDHNCAMDTVGHGQGFALQIGGQYYCLTLRPGVLDSALADVPPVMRALHVTICRNLIIRPLIGDKGKLLDHIAYVVDSGEVSKTVESGGGQMAVYLPPFDMKQFMNAVETGEVLPHKSTYFYPKLVTGLVIYRYSV